MWSSNIIYSGLESSGFSTTITYTPDISGSVVSSYEATLPPDLLEYVGVESSASGIRFFSLNPTLEGLMKLTSIKYLEDDLVVHEVNNWKAVPKGASIIQMIPNSKSKTIYSIPIVCEYTEPAGPPVARLSASTTASITIFQDYDTNRVKLVQIVSEEYPR